MLYRCIQEHFESWFAQCREGHDDDGPVPPYVEGEFRRYLECSVLAQSFARAPCGDCGHDFLIASSCKGRSVCRKAIMQQRWVPISGSAITGSAPGRAL